MSAHRRPITFRLIAVVAAAAACLVGAGGSSEPVRPKRRTYIVIKVKTPPPPRASVRTAARTSRPARILWQGPRDKKLIALTFDDGPKGETTDQLLNVLDREQVPATFFVVGKMAMRRGGLLRRMVAEGHQVANHTYNHRPLTQMSLHGVRDDYITCGNIIRNAIGYLPTCVRPPGGVYNEEVVQATHEMGLTTVLWNVNSRDFEKPKPEVLLANLLPQIRPGAIVLMHDGVPATIHILPTLIHRLRDEGYRFVTVDTMLRASGFVAPLGEKPRQASTLVKRVAPALPAATLVVKPTAVPKPAAPRTVAKATPLPLKTAGTLIGPQSPASSEPAIAEARQTARPTKRRWSTRRKWRPNSVRRRSQAKKTGRVGRPTRRTTRVRPAAGSAGPFYSPWPVQ